MAGEPPHACAGTTAGDNSTMARLSRRALWLSLASTALIAACSDDQGGAAPPAASGGAAGAAAAAPPSVPPALTQEDLAAIWPEAQSRVYSRFDLVVGVLPGQSVPGRIAVLRGQKPLPKGAAVTAGADVQLLPPGTNFGEVVLPAGSQALCLQVLDAGGTSMGPEWAKEIGYEVVEPAGTPRVFFAAPADGATVGAKLHVVFGVEGVGVVPAGEKVLDKTVGHHHVLIDGAAMAPSIVIPNDAANLHYGKAQTEADLELAPGTHRLTMQFGDANHRSYGPRLAATITVVVQ